MLTTKQIKETFIDFFTNRDHTKINESSLIPQNDDSLLFTNSGMVQFKNIFLGYEEPTYNKVTNAQICIRAGGKHNDLDDVGKDSYHHTLFTMLGNWSFNYKQEAENKSYFKKEAIDMAWELLINVFKLPIENIYVTYFGGTIDNNLLEDTETKELWLRYLPGDKILPFGMKDNFWQMAETGPCGPCTEIHFDRKGNRDASQLVNKDDPTVIEIWNLVFMQFNRLPTHLEQLASCHVDTGAGLERLASILQNTTNYQTDEFKLIINIIQTVCNSPDYADLYQKDDPIYTNTAYRVISDHLRTMIYAIKDGCKPSGTSRGHVIRRVIRRAIRYGTKLNAPDGFLSKCALDLMESWELSNKLLLEVETKNNILTTIQEEETKFSKSMKKGLKYFNKLLKKGINILTGKDAFLLNSTYGFPVDIIKQIVEENDIQLDLLELEKLMADHVLTSKK